MPVLLRGSRNKAVCGPCSFWESLRPSSFTLSQEMAFLSCSSPGNCAGSQANYRFSVDYSHHIFISALKFDPLVPTVSPGLHDFAMCSEQPQHPFRLLLSVVKMGTCSIQYCLPLLPNFLTVDINTSDFIFPLSEVQVFSGFQPGIHVFFLFETVVGVVLS